MKVTFIYHSSYLVELDSCCLLFDYFEGELPPITKPLYIFASHSHEDHFSPAVFNIEAGGEPIHYFLSDDIFTSRVPEYLKEQVTFTAAHSIYQMGGMQVATLESTDRGVAFLVDCGGETIYHAGDLNCWVWDGAPKFQNDLMERQYRSEIEILKDKKIDVAFVPLDPRQEESYHLGMVYFLQTAQAKHVFPMHMWGDYTVVPKFCKEHPEYAGVIEKISLPGQVTEIE